MDHSRNVLPCIEYLYELLNGDLAAKTGQGTLSRDLMDRDYNCSIPSKVHGKYIYEDQSRKMFNF